MKTNKGLMAVLVVAGLLLVVVSGVYFAEPARSLPAFFPGHDSTLSRHHTTHAVVALVVAALCFVGAWMVSPRPTPRTS